MTKTLYVVLAVILLGMSSAVRAETLYVAERMLGVVEHASRVEHRANACGR